MLGEVFQQLGPMGLDGLVEQALFGPELAPPKEVVLRASHLLARLSQGTARSAARQPQCSSSSPVPPTFLAVWARFLALQVT